ncbi:hypothetical protein L596_015669 [Steinernema carpocapsae]|uniref:Uncharacterized protein n=1 Tax=Steinernema carpocapsae TaxID=34508 RepID=A0A4V6XW89_STECR|nr:hypothetical protein L596_015669 [Steinernema carpocapsae]
MRNAVLFVFAGFFAVLMPLGAAGTLEDEILENIALLEDFELKQLRDFVRGKGRGSVSRITLDNLGNPQDGDEMDPADPNVINVSEQMSMIPSFIVPSIIYPSSTTTTTKRPPAKSKKPKPPTLSKEDFKELAGLFQQFIDNRKGGRRPTSPKRLTTTTTSTTTTTTPEPTTTRRIRWRRPDANKLRGKPRIYEAETKHLPVITSPDEESWKGSVSQVSQPPQSSPKPEQTQGRSEILRCPL